MKFIIDDENENAPGVNKDPLSSIRRIVLEMADTVRQVKNPDNPALPLAGSVIAVALVYIGDCIRSKR